MLLVCLPAFSWLFLRLRKAELDNPALRLEPSKRRFSQITQILSFLTCFFTIVTVVYSLISAAGGEDVGGIGKILGVGAIILIIAGGILTYYWFDEHRLVNGR
jgi:FtsH-binding integral membrane protein